MTFKTISDKPLTHLVDLDDAWFDYKSFASHSLKDGIWIHAHSYFGTKLGKGVSAVYTSDAERNLTQATVRDWHPTPPNPKKRRVFKKVF